MRSAWRRWIRSTGRDRGEVDPILVLVSLSVLALVVGGITLAVMNAQKWGVTQAFDSVEQTSEDAARLAWMGDVGTSTAVLPAAKSGTTAKTSVRFDTTTRDPAWPAAAQCRAVTWWLEDTVMDPKSPNAIDPQTGNPIPAVAVHRSIAYYAAKNTDGSCVLTATPLRPATNNTVVKNAQRGAQFSYVNGHLRDLVFPFTATPGRESCEAVAKGATAQLTTCTNRSKTKIVAQRTLWEWADPTPVQVLLVMTTDQAGMGQGYGTQIGWRELTGRRELVGDANSPVTDTLGNPPAPAAHTAAPVTARVNVTTAPNDASADYVTVRRNDTRDLDGFEYRCSETLNGTHQRWVPGSGANGAATTAMPTTTAMTIPGTKAGHAYVCQQRGWVNAVESPNLGKRFTAGISAWSPSSAVATRRPASTVVTGALNQDTGLASFSWAARPGAVGYHAQVRINGVWSDLPNFGAGATTWSRTIGPDTQIVLRVRPFNDGGYPSWANSAALARRLDAPNARIDDGIVGRSTYIGSWAHVPGFDATRGHVYEFRYKTANSQAWSEPRTQTHTQLSLQGVLPGRTVSYQVRAKGVYVNSAWASAAATRPVAQPAAPGVNMGTGVGVVHTSANPVGCEAGTTTQYAVWSSTSGWRGWSESRDASYRAGEGTTVSVAWKARCVPGEGAVGPESGESGGSAMVPYTAPATPTMRGTTNGNVGTNITFSWSGSGLYYQVVNSGFSHRAYTTASSLTIGRESGQTCSRVRAARTADHAARGVWSDWSGLACGTTTIPIPGAPGGSGQYNRGSTAGSLASVSAVVDGVGGATSYEARFRYSDAYGASEWFTRGATPGVRTSLGACIVTNSTVHSVAIQARAGNAYGWSGWNGLGVAQGAPLNTCM